jgi:cell division protein FtsI/penicillin-binding protein 2
MHRPVLLPLLALAVVAAFGVVMVRLYRVQVLSHDTYMAEAAVTRQGAITVPASRGAILDATGYPLATSIDAWDVYIDRFQWRDHEKAQAAAIDAQAVRTRAMPIGNLTGMTDDERRIIAAWVAAGAPAR